MTCFSDQRKAYIGDGPITSILTDLYIQLPNSPAAEGSIHQCMRTKISRSFVTADPEYKPSSSSCTLLFPYTHPPTHPSLWYPLPLPCDSFHIFLSRLYAQARTRSFMHSPYVTDGLIKGCGWSGLVDRALIESCLCNEFCLWTYSLYLCVCNYIYWLQLSQIRRLSVVTHQVTAPAISEVYLSTGFLLKHSFTLQSWRMMCVLDFVWRESESQILGPVQVFIYLYISISRDIDR